MTKQIVTFAVIAQTLVVALGFLAPLGAAAVLVAGVSSAQAATPTAKQNKAAQKDTQKAVKKMKDSHKSFVKSKRKPLYKEMKSANLATAKENAALARLNKANDAYRTAQDNLNNNPTSQAAIKAESKAFQKQLKAESAYNIAATDGKLARDKFALSRSEYNTSKKLIVEARALRRAERELGGQLKVTDKARTKMEKANAAAGVQPAGAGQQANQGVYAGINAKLVQKALAASQEFQAQDATASTMVTNRDAQIARFNTSRQDFINANAARKNGPSLSFVSVAPGATPQPKAFMSLSN